MFPPSSTTGRGWRPLTFSVGVVVPVYNGTRFIERCIDSIFSQTLLPQEVVVIDDGSTDGTGSVVASLQRRYPHLRYVFQENSGQAAARNRGIQQLRTTHVAFCDADDYWYSEKLERQREDLEESGARCVYSDAYIVSEAAPSVKVIFSKLYGLPAGSVYRKLLFGNFICTSTVLVERLALAEVGGFTVSKSTKYVEDYDLWLKLAAQQQFAVVKSPLVAYQKHAHGSSRATVRSALASLRLLCHQYTSSVAGTAVVTLAILRQCLVVIMYLVKADKLLSPLSRVSVHEKRS